jgi:hypothetical protein
LKDTVIKANGKSRRILAPADMPSTYDAFRTQAMAGNAFFDISLNEEGCEIVGTPLAKETLLNEETAEKFGMLGNDPSVNDVLKILNTNTASRVPIPSGANLDDYKDTSKQYSATSSVGATVTNKPLSVSSAFSLDIIATYDDVVWISQVLKTHTSRGVTTYTRVLRNAGDWTAWRAERPGESGGLVKAGGSAKAITVTYGSFLPNDGEVVNFIASNNNGGAATTLNVNGFGAKPIYNAATENNPTIKSGNAYTVWYSSADDCFFVKAGSGVTAAELAYGTTYTVFSGNYSSLPVIPIQSSYKKIYTLNFPESVRGAVRVELAFDNVSTATVSFKIGNTTGSASGTNTASSNITIPDNGVVEISAYAGSGSSSTVRLKSIAVKIASGICNGTPATS